MDLYAGFFDGKTRLEETKTNNIAGDSIYFIDEREGWAVGRLWPIDIVKDEMQPLVLRTSDGGQAWQSSGPQADDLFFSSVHSQIQTTAGSFLGTTSIRLTIEGTLGEWS